MKTLKKNNSSNSPKIDKTSDNHRYATPYGYTLIELMITVVVIAIFASLVLGGLGGCSSSEGSRTGVITKFSYKGLVNKSWEGELTMPGMTTTEQGGLTANIWSFSCKNAEVASKIEEALNTGRKVALKYKQAAFVNPMAQNTTYDVIDVKFIGDQVTPNVTPSATIKK